MPREKTFYGTCFLRKTTNLEEVFQLLAVVQGRNVGRELQQIFSTLASLFNNGFVKSP